MNDRDHAVPLRLAEPVGQLDVWPGCRHVVTRAEREVLASPPSQRLRRLRQMGLAFHAWPNAENTRASHSLGVAYWSARYLDALVGTEDPATRAAVAEASSGLDGLSLDVVVRLFGLLHDIDLLPLGHTLRYQSGLFAEAPGRPRLAACVASIKAHAREHAFGEAADDPERRAWLRSFDRHLEAAMTPDDLPHARLTAEIVNAGMGADLLDFAVRDSQAIGRAQQLHGDLPGALRLTPTDSGWALAVDVAHEDTAADRVAMVDDLYRARGEIFAASVFHPVKLAADAMLDGALRRLGGEACRTLLPEGRLLEMGDDELIDRIATAERKVATRQRADPIAVALRAGNLHDEVWRTEDLAAIARRADAQGALALDPAWRNDAEERVLDRLPWASPGDVIVAVSPSSMQAKPATAPFVGADGQVFTLAEASDHGFATEAGEVADRYAHLWSLRVYLAPRWRHRAPEVHKAASAVLGG